VTTRVSMVLGAFLGLAAAGLTTGLAPATAPAQEQRAGPRAGGKQNAVDGEQLFATSCGWCHQEGGRSVGKGPKLSNSPQTDQYIINRIKNGKVGAMPAFATIFTDEQIRAIVAYIRSLKD
jgi:mono/diheme cytochrome c family protein